MVKTVDRIGCGPFILFLSSQNGKLLEETTFSLDIYFRELSKQKICQVNFGKLLDMGMPNWLNHPVGSVMENILW